MSEAPITVYYWGMFGRGGSIIRMLEHAKVPYEHKSEFPDLATRCGAFGCQDDGGVFAPPVIVDGDLVISQSTACCMYIGQKCGLDEGIACMPVALQYLADIVDTFENEYGQNKMKGPLALKAFIESDRFAKRLACLERGIKGPFYFGEKPTFVDFFLCAHVDWAQTTSLDLLKQRGVDPLAAYPKLLSAVDGIRSLESYKSYAGPLQTAREDFVLKAEYIDAYFASVDDASKL